MNTSIDERRRWEGRFIQRLAFWTITLIHDNPLLPWFKNPYDILKQAGLQPGQTVLEVGCGPGYFTITAARLVGKDGLVYAVDVNPFAVARVRRKIEREGLKNVVPLLANASRTTIPDRTIDLVFVFGLPRIAGGLQNLLAEMGRILEPSGTMAFQISEGLHGDLIETMKRCGFETIGQKGRIFLFSGERGSVAPVPARKTENVS